MNDSQFKNIFAQMNNEVLGADEGWNDISNTLANNKNKRNKRIVAFSLIGVAMLITTYSIFMVLNTADVPQLVPTGDGFQIDVVADSTIIDTAPVVNSDAEQIPSSPQTEVQPPITQTRKEKFKPTATKPISVSDSVNLPKQTPTPVQQPLVAKKKGSTRILIVEDTIVQYDTIRVDSRK